MLKYVASIFGLRDWFKIFFTSVKIIFKNIAAFLKTVPG